MDSLPSRSSTKRIYEGITLLLADPEKQFPEEFDPQRPSKKRRLKMVSRESFTKKVDREEGVGVVPLEEFSPEGIVEETAEDVELRDGATYIVIPRESKTIEKRFEGLESWQRNQTSADERMLVGQAVKYLQDSGHDNVRPWCKKKLTGPNGWSREVDTAAIADGCAIVVEHKNLMDKNGALQLYDLVNDITEFKDSGEGSVADFKGKRIIGVLAGPAETTNPNDKRAMDAMLNNNGFLKWFENKDYGDDPCSPLQASGASWDAPTPSEPSSSGPAAPAAVPRRVGRVLRPALMRRSGMLVHPRLASKSAGFRIIK